MRQPCSSVATTFKYDVIRGNVGTDYINFAAAEAVIPRKGPRSRSFEYKTNAFGLFIWLEPSARIIKIYMCCALPERMTHNS